jgi:hypothetical protein
MCADGLLAYRSYLQLWTREEMKAFLYSLVKIPLVLLNEPFNFRKLDSHHASVFLFGAFVRCVQCPQVFCLVSLSVKL